MYLWNILRRGGIAFAVAYAVAALAFLILGLVAAGNASAWATQNAPERTGLLPPEETVAATTNMAVIYFTLCGIFALACTFSGILVHLTELKMNRKAAIALAIVSFCVGAFFPAALFLMDAITTR